MSVSHASDRERYEHTQVRKQVLTTWIPPQTRFRNGVTQAMDRSYGVYRESTCAAEVTTGSNERMSTWSYSWTHRRIYQSAYHGPMARIPGIARHTTGLTTVAQAR